MPEEINRIVTDSVSDLLFVSEPDGVKNLATEGHSPEHIHYVGNVMIDTLKRMLPVARESDILKRLELEPQEYGVVTFHRPANVDQPQTLTNIVDVLVATSARLPLVFPVHPRTQKRLSDFNLLARLEASPGIRLQEPLGYIDCLALTSHAKIIMTDSGGLQEEATVLGVPCLTMRPNTERPITVSRGTSTLVDNDPVRLSATIDSVLDGNYKTGQVPELWDGKAAERISAILCRDEENGRHGGKEK